MILVAPLHIFARLLDPNFASILSSAIPFAICTHLRARLEWVIEFDSPMKRFAGFEIAVLLANFSRVDRLVDDCIDWFPANHRVESLASNGW
jgi:hypothetical protein